MSKIFHFLVKIQHFFAKNRDFLFFRACLINLISRMNVKAISTIRTKYTPLYIRTRFSLIIGSLIHAISSSIIVLLKNESNINQIIDFRSYKYNKNQIFEHKPTPLYKVSKKRIFYSIFFSPSGVAGPRNGGGSGVGKGQVSL